MKPYDLLEAIGEADEKEIASAIYELIANDLDVKGSEAPFFFDGAEGVKQDGELVIVEYENGQRFQINIMELD